MRRDWFPVLALLLLGLALYLPLLGASGLWDPWEPRYAQAAREMAAADNWIMHRQRSMCYQILSTRLVIDVK